ncbi:Nucleoside ABC transporter, permease protein 2 [Pseudonocardia sp. Ae168_Ps1]|uniref:ABC transporter permease n=1 Tax=unclassified Pseudonocardia TaxID=2619320 RepID=UPI0001FFE602|nr:MULTISPECIES: ABC transporter permease [unclassified Pseudonocardia]ALE75924.1 ABC transporter permease [Pseudonocardia sp. EC080625-04]ALL75558.1 ABC transporter permease [Pseudonocardia sp. EC080610-09]ALL82585.1 ABC transporter permease [Pseudonocardia sp. EC080619-01]OLL74021.1 Nucleoside ABC transporter, permease protein 2 [Pseudonocardia sp. Ae150A_Ps1]OLL79997.1 Nucleoside ABC transporter, permease protein 2 [Pseudonocardia sp. Ae168_Ps1]
MTAAVLERAGRLPGWARSALIAAGLVLVLSITVTLTGQTQLASSGTSEAAVRLGLPILFAALGGLWAERAGIINIGLEGMMVLGTWGAAWAGYQWGPWAAMLGGLAFGALGGLVHAVATVTFNVNHIVSGVAITLLGTGITKYLATLVFAPVSQNPRQSPRLDGFTEFSVPGVSQGLQALEAQQRVFVSDLAGLLSGLVTGLTPIVVLGFALVPFSFWVLWRTPFGLRLRSSGESPVAAESLGVDVVLHKYAAVIVSGGLAGLGGAALVLNPGQLGYLENQVGGRGYIGLAAMIFGNWRPAGLLVGSALFGYVDGLQLRAGGEAVHALLYAATLVAVVVAVLWAIRRMWTAAAVALGAGVAVYALYWSIESVPSEFASYAPQLVTLIVLAAASQRLRPPARLGDPYRRGEGR